ncbi:uncharacterized protein E0L32_009439 [Thyridium curvatum]|uniref:Uncharacterized protein n=1 Tax=Thyridium curvatum TaxID=1093900 RepID=A0A507AHF8_9PEZI|nr:uncharacterized protein E0L32_009439 [Thyridium curvatum]TPX09395.1 hypothetical protein E0L32_009439 [Thyridium curvatum]
MNSEDEAQMGNGEVIIYKGRRGLSANLTQMSAIVQDVKKVDTSIDEDFGEHSVSRVLNRRKIQPWKNTYKANPEDVPTTASLHDKPWFRAEQLEEDYDAHSGA